MEFSEGRLFETFRYSQRGTFIDVGAHRASVCGPMIAQGWQTLAFEPHPDFHRELAATYADEPHVTLIRKAVSDTTGEMTFYTSERHPGIDSLVAFDPTHKATHTVEVTTLAAELDQLGVTDVTAIKIDAEGADLMVLRGMDFKRWRPELVMVEFIDDRTEEHFGYNHHDMARVMLDEGYAVFVSEWAPLTGYDAAIRWRRLRRYRPAAAMAPMVWGNLLFVQPHDAWKLRLAAARALVTLNTRPAIRRLPLVSVAGSLRRALRR